MYDDNAVIELSGWRRCRPCESSGLLGKMSFVRLWHYHSETCIAHDGYHFDPQRIANGFSAHSENV